MFILPALFLVGLAGFVSAMARQDFSRFVEITLCITYPQELLTTDLGSNMPGSKLDFVLIYLSIVIVGYTLFRGLQCLIKPGEETSDHIKREILNSK